MIKNISKEDAQKLYNSASTHVTAGANMKRVAEGYAHDNKQQPNNITRIIASQKGKGSK